MTRLVWNDFGANEFQSGVDRVVLYVDGHTGVPWNGVTKISVKPSGGQPRPVYLDGVKIVNPHSPQEATGSISAFYSPEEFDMCDGTRMVMPGLKVGQQTRAPFNLSYRTRVGSDVGSETHYRIHFLFNLMASSSDKSHRTNSQSVEPSTLVWDFVSRPLVVPGYFPSAYMYVDSKTYDPIDLVKLEDIIYGTNLYPPLAPTPEGLIYLEAARFDDGKYDLDVYA